MLTPENLAAWAEEIAAGSEHLRFEALGPEEIRAAGMGAFSAVSQGSDNPPRLITLAYEPPEAREGRPSVGLVGKAITFDSRAALAEARLPHGRDEVRHGRRRRRPGRDRRHRRARPAGAHPHGRPLLREPAQRARLPAGDIVTSLSGKTIEISTRTPRGRLILADALWYARESGATHVLDLATLTGGIVVAMGDLYAGLFANDEDWATEIAAAAEASGDHAWRCRCTSATTATTTPRSPT